LYIFSDPVRRGKGMYSIKAGGKPEGRTKTIKKPKSLKLTTLRGLR